MKESIDTTALGGAVMPRDLFDEFYQRVQEESILLDQVRTVTLDGEQEAIPKIGVGERLMRQVDEGESVEDHFVTADTGAVELEPEKTVIPWELTNEAVEDTVDDVADIVLDKFETQFAADAQELGIIGDDGDADPFVGIKDGWLKILTEDTGDDRLGGATSPQYDHGGGGVNTALFDEVIQTMEQKYLRTDPAFIMSRRNVQEYKNFLTDRETGLGDSVLFGDNDLTPFGYDVVGVHGMPDNEAIFTNPENLIWALRRDVEIDVLEKSDETLRRDLYARYAMRARHDYQVEDLQAAVHIDDIQTV